MENKKNWYAIQRDAEDNDWGTGSFEWEEAIEMAKKKGYERIAEIDGQYNEDGEPTVDPICIAEYMAGEDF